MNEQLMEAFIKLIQTGGNIALWGIVLWQLLAWLKIATVALFVFLCVKMMAAVLSKGIK